MVICLEQGADLHMAQLIPLPLTVSCSSKIQIGCTFLVPAHPGSPGQSAVKRVCVGCIQNQSGIIMMWCGTQRTFCNTSNGPLSAITWVSRYLKKPTPLRKKKDSQTTRSVVLDYTLGDSNVVLFHIYASEKCLMLWWCLPDKYVLLMSRWSCGHFLKSIDLILLE